MKQKRHWHIRLSGVGVIAEDETRARNLARFTVREICGGDSKRAQERFERFECYIEAEPFYEVEEIGDLAAFAESKRDDLDPVFFSVFIPSRRVRDCRDLGVSPYSEDDPWTERRRELFDAARNAGQQAALAGEQTTGTGS